MTLTTVLLSSGHLSNASERTSVENFTKSYDFTYVMTVEKSNHFLVTSIILYTQSKVLKVYDTTCQRQP